MNNGSHSLIIFTNLSPCPKNQKGRKSGNHCQDWHFPMGCWHKRQVRSSIGIYRSRKLETNPLTNSDGLILRIINNLGSLTRRAWLICIVSPTLASFQFHNYPKILSTSSFWPLCSFCLEEWLPPDPSCLSLNAQSSERSFLILLCRLRKTPFLPSHPWLKYTSFLTLTTICDFGYILQECVTHTLIYAST